MLKFFKPILLLYFFIPVFVLAQIPTNGLVAYYPFNGNANDESGSNNNGTVNGATLTSDRFGNNNSAYYFNQSTITAKDNNLPLGGSARTVSMWVNSGIKYPNINTGNPIHLLKYGPSTVGNHFVVAMWGNVLRVSNYSSPPDIDWSYSHPINQWFHLTVTLDVSRNINIYINGILNYTSSVESWNTLSNQTLTIGDISQQTKLDDICIYNRVLSQSEILQLYNEPNPNIKKGVTVIVHGFSAFGGLPDWTITMAKAIQERANGATIYKNNPNTGQWELVGNEINVNGEIILLYDWADLSNNGLTSSTYEGNGYLEAAADNLFAMLNVTPLQGLNNNLLSTDKPIHFIAHSRGNILSLQVLYRIKKYFPYRKIEQFTLLDPHPATTFGDVHSSESSSPQSLPCVLGSANNCSFTAGCNGVNDISIKLPENVQTADCYYRQDGSYEGGLDLGAFDGVSVQGIGNFNRQLKNAVLDIPFSIVIPCYSATGGAHSKVHSWYYGTIASEGSTPSYDGCVITDDNPIGWYNSDVYDSISAQGGRKQTGFNYSRIGGLGYPSNTTVKMTLAEMEAALKTRTGFELRPVFNGNFNYGNGRAGWTMNGGQSSTSNIDNNLGILNLGLSELQHSFFYFAPEMSANNIAEDYKWLRFKIKSASSTRNFSVEFKSLTGTIQTFTSIINLGNANWYSVYCPIPNSLKSKVGSFKIINNDFLASENVFVDDFEFTNINPTNNEFKMSDPIISIELLDFSVFKQKYKNLLKWQTTNEKNNKGFDIERSSNGNNWEKIGFVAAKSNNSTYQYIDDTPLSISYYRLRQIDIDGKEELSKTISLSRENNEDIVLYPNPTTGKVSVQTTNFKQCAVKIYNNLGQAVLIQNLGTPEIDLSILPKGVYFIELSIEGNLSKKRIVKM